MSYREATARDARRPTSLSTVAELASQLRINRASVYQLPIPYVLVGARRRYRQEDIDAYLEARRVTAA